MPVVREDESPGDDYFNDLSRRPSGGVDDPQNGECGMDEDVDGASVPKPKRIACVLCRKRKLKCNGDKPSCGTCTRLQHDCSYDEIRRKSGPKRGYVKALEARLAQVETLLKTQETPPVARGRQAHVPHNDMPAPEHPNIAFSADNIDLIAFGEKAITSHTGPKQTQYPFAALGAAAIGDEGMTPDASGPREMIGLGLDEPLPSADAIMELTNTYFDKCHRSLPMIHRPRFYAAMNLAPNMRPPICLRYAMWCQAAAVTDKYESFQEHFYQRARKYIQKDEMKGHGESMITVAHCQTWILLGAYEFKLMYFPRAWMSAGRACRLSQMMGLHRQDGAGLDVKQCLPPPRDWTEREERRRSFWGAFAVDRYSSIGTGWPMTIEERDIMTLMPSSNDAFELSRPEKTLTLDESLRPGGARTLSSFGGVVMMACLFGRNLTHLHRPGPDDKEADLNGDFWKRHREMDHILLKTAMTLPDRLRLPSGLNDPNVVFLNMNVHTSTICLHQAAIFKADKNRLPTRVSAESKVRCITAAAEIASIMRQISHLDLSAMNSFISFCLYVAARVFVQYLKSRPNDSPVRSSLQFLLSAMHAIKRKNPLTESFIVQLDVDLESAGLENSDELRSAAQFSGDPTRSEGCPMSSYLGMPSLPTYGDNGLARYTGVENPRDAPMAGVFVPTDTTSHDGRKNSNPPASYSIPTRIRSPGSMPGSMDTSPDASGDHRTPNSQHQSSSRTSNTGYSPQVYQHNAQDDIEKASAQAVNDFFDSSVTDYSADFDMHNYTSMHSQNHQQQQGFVLPPNLMPALGHTGLTPGPTGMTPQADMTGLSEEDWNIVLNGFQTWDSGMTLDGPLFQTPS